VQNPTPAKVPTTPGPTIQGPAAHVINARDVPMTAQDVQALRIKLTDLRNELQDAAERRSAVNRALRSADLATRGGLESRLQVLDARIVQIEKDITDAGAQLKNAPTDALIAGTAATTDPLAVFQKISGDIVPIIAILSVFVLGPFAIAISRFIWRRAMPPARPAMVDQGTQQRLEQLQQAVDTIAVEVERISEGQRFVTRLLSERDRPALGVGAAEPVRAPAKSAVSSERG
jgi:hypothetical protein